MPALVADIEAFAAAHAAALGPVEAAPALPSDSRLFIKSRRGFSSAVSLDRDNLRFGDRLPVVDVTDSAEAPGTFKAGMRSSGRVLGPRVVRVGGGWEADFSASRAVRRSPRRSLVCQHAPNPLWRYPRPASGKGRGKGLSSATRWLRGQRTQIALTVAGLTDPYFRRARVRFVNLIADRDGVVQSLPGLDETRRLASFAALGWPAPGAKLRRTVDLLSSPGMVDLCHPESEQIERDDRRIRELEAYGALIVLDQQPILHGGDLS